MSAGETRPPPREAFLLEAGRAGAGWPQAVADYLATFEAGEPVALVVAPPPGLTPPQAAEAIGELMGRTGRPSCAEVILLERPDELLEVLRAFSAVHWVPERGSRPVAPAGSPLERLARRRGAEPSSGASPGAMHVSQLPEVIRHMAFSGEGTDLCLAAGALPLPVSFNSPVPDIADLARRDVWSIRSELPGIDFRPERQVAYLAELGRAHGHECRWPLAPAADPRDFHVDNQSFSFGCAAGLHAVIRHHRPRRIIEVGSGHSSKVISAAVLLEAQEGRAIDYTVIDPFPSKLTASLPGLGRLVPSPVEVTPLEPFLALREDDLLFIDSSHFVKIGGDVNFLFLEVLPRLAPGVVIHVHDVGLPFEYPKVYCTNPRYRVFWTEAYLLQAFLAFNSEFEVLLGMAYVMSDHLPVFRAAFPAYDPAVHTSGSGSFWLRRKARS